MNKLLSSPVLSNNGSPLCITIPWAQYDAAVLGSISHLSSVTNYPLGYYLNILMSQQISSHKYGSCQTGYVSDRRLEAVNSMEYFLEKKQTENSKPVSHFVDKTV